MSVCRSHNRELRVDTVAAPKDRSQLATGLKKSHLEFCPKARVESAGISLSAPTSPKASAANEVFPEAPNPAVPAPFTSLVVAANGSANPMANGSSHPAPASAVFCPDDLPNVPAELAQSLSHSATTYPSALPSSAPSSNPKAIMADTSEMPSLAPQPAPPSAVDLIASEPSSKSAPSPPVSPRLQIQCAAKAPNASVPVNLTFGSIQLESTTAFDPHSVLSASTCPTAANCSSSSLLAAPGDTANTAISATHQSSSGSASQVSSGLSDMNRPLTSLVVPASPTTLFSREELDDIFKNFEATPYLLSHTLKREIIPSSGSPTPPPDTLLPISNVVDVTPLAVLPPVDVGEESGFESDDYLDYDDALLVHSPYFQPLAPPRGRGKKKAVTQSDRILRPRKGNSSKV